MMFNIFMGVLISFLALFLFFGFGYIEGKQGMCEDQFGGVYVQGKCLDKDALLNP